MTRLHILQIFSRYLHYGGEEGSVSRIAAVLREIHDVGYFSIATEDLLAKGMRGRLLLPFLALHHGAAAKRLEREQQENKFDLWQIHNVFPAISPAAYATAFRMGVPLIHYLHNYKFACPTGFMFARGKEYTDGLHGNFWPAIRDGIWHESRAKTAVMSAAILYAKKLGVFHNVTRWVAISHAQKAIHVEMGIPAEKIDVIHHFIETPSRVPELIPQNGHALFIGRLSAEKGVDRLLRAWSHLPRHRKLIIAGDGPEYQSLIRLKEELSLENVSFVGFVSKDQQAGLWNGAMFSIVPSIWQEPFGMVVLEAWAQERPVVAHRIGALPEIVKQGETGFLADPGDPRDLAAALEKAFSAGRDQLSEMGRKGHRLLSGYYSKERWLDDITTVYRNAGLV